MKYLLALFLLVTPLMAGNLGLTCNGLHPQATEVKYYVEGVVDPVATSPPGEGVVITDVPDGCTYRNYSCTQVVEINGTALESEKSGVTSAPARPRVFSVELTEEGLTQVNGDNFLLDSYVYIDGVKITETTRVNCQSLRVPEQAFLSLTVEDDILGLNVTYTLPIPTPENVTVY